jgi:hypothetical protein
MDHISTFGNGPEAFRVCSVCNPDPSFKLPETFDTDAIKMPYHCKDCRCEGEPKIDIDIRNGRQYIEICCSDCGSDRIQRVCDRHDEAAYRMEE